MSLTAVTVLMCPVVGEWLVNRPTALASVIFISFVTSCVGLQGLMSVTWASHIAASVLTGR